VSSGGVGDEERFEPGEATEYGECKPAGKPSPPPSEELCVAELEGDAPELKLAAPSDECAPGDAKSKEGCVDLGEKTPVPVPLALCPLL
jgi:hypothetical protein